jgi:hypothetical protein
MPAIVSKMPSRATLGSFPRRNAGNLLATTRTDHGALPL